jgi:hypothetical protein
MGVRASAATTPDERTRELDMVERLADGKRTSLPPRGRDQVLRGRAAVSAGVVGVITARSLRMKAMNARRAAGM